MRSPFDMDGSVFHGFYDSKWVDQVPSLHLAGDDLSDVRCDQF